MLHICCAGRLNLINFAFLRKHASLTFTLISNFKYIYILSNYYFLRIIKLLSNNFNF